VHDAHSAPADGKVAVAVLTPVGNVLQREADEIIAPGAEGELGVLPGHVPFLSALKPGVLTVRTGGERHILAVGAGFLQVSAHSGVAILVDRAERPADIDVAAATADKARLEEEVKTLSAAAGAQEGALAAAATQLAWAEARIAAAADKNAAQ